MILKALNTELSFTSANTVYDAKLVRIYAAANSVITVTSATNPTATFTMPQGTIEILEKLSTDTIAGSTTIKCTPVSYKN